MGRCRDALKVVFQLVDRDGTGRLHREKLVEAFRAFGIEDGHIEGAIKAFEMDTDSCISLEEFLSVLDVPAQDGRANNGKVSGGLKDELAHISAVLSNNEDFISRIFRARRGGKHWVFDMDGVIYRGNDLCPGVERCLRWLRSEGKDYRFLTNNSRVTAKRLYQKLKRLGVHEELLHPSIFWTAAMSTAAFVKRQRPLGCRAFVVGGPGLHAALEETEVVEEVDASEATRSAARLANAQSDSSSDGPKADPAVDFVIIGESDTYATADFIAATKFVHQGAILLGTNEDTADPVEHDMIEPSCGAWVSVVEKATGKTAYFCGKPNPLNLSTLLHHEKWHAEDVIMVGDRMETDVRGAMEADIFSILVLSGMTASDDVGKFPFRPGLVLGGVNDIPPADFEGND